MAVSMEVIMDRFKYEMTNCQTDLDALAVTLGAAPLPLRIGLSMVANTQDTTVIVTTDCTIKGSLVVRRCEIDQETIAGSLGATARIAVRAIYRLGESVMRESIL